MSSSYCFQLNKREALDRMVAAAAAYALPQLPLYRAASAGLVNVIQPLRNGRIPGRLLKETRRPLLILLGDDDYRSTGPDGWAAASQVQRWANFAIVHAAGATPAHYELAVERAQISRRLVFVESSGAHEGAWIAWAKDRMAVLAIRALPGTTHPTVPAPGSLN